ncbi:MAG TPA: ZIP family metal transporter, partial [Planctomycetaceae bacterium]|nr:ZIP family metal transporter [Planctomycetaceae bacterium]
MTSDSHPPDLILAAAFDGRPLLLIAVYCLLIVGASLVGGWLPTVVRLTHVRTQVLVSFVAGLMLGIAFLHLLPHAVAEIGRSEVLSLDGEVHALDRAVRWTLGGFLAMFFLIRAFHFHHHGDIELPANVHQHDHAGCDVQSHAGRATSAPPAPPPPHEHHGHTPHRHAAPAPAPAPLPARHGLSWLGVFFGLAVHTLIDGMALAASVRAEAAHGDGLGVYGVG